MKYPQNLTLVQLAEYYHTFGDSKCLEELTRRDHLAELQAGQKEQESDSSQLVFDFHKDVVSDSAPANTLSEDNPWKDAYEAGYRAGSKAGSRKEVDNTRINGKKMKLVPMGGMNAGGYYEEVK